MGAADARESDFCCRKAQDPQSERESGNPRDAAATHINYLPPNTDSLNNSLFSVFGGKHWLGVI